MLRTHHVAVDYKRHASKLRQKKALGFTLSVRTFAQKHIEKSRIGPVISTCKLQKDADVEKHAIAP